MLSGCALSRQLSEHRREMKRIAYSDLNKKQRFDDFMVLMVGVLREANQMNSPLKTVKYVDKFTKQNEAELKVVTTELTDWIGQMKVTEGIAFGARTLQKPYSRELSRLIPDIQQKAKANGYQLNLLEKTLLLLKVRRLIKKGKKKE